MSEELKKLFDILKKSPMLSHKPLSDGALLALAQDLIDNGVKVPPVKVGDYLWTDVGEDEIIIDKIRVMTVTETENGYDICLGEGLGKDYRITEKDIDNGVFFRTEEPAKKILTL